MSSSKYDVDDDDDDIQEHEGGSGSGTEFDFLPFREYSDTVKEMDATYKKLTRLYFLNTYPRIPVKNIDNILKTHKNHLFPTFLAFDSGESNEKQIVIEGQIIAYGKPREPDAFYPQSDPEFYREYLFVEEKRLWNLQQKADAASHKETIKRAKAVGRQTGRCPICDDGKDEKETETEFLYSELVRCTDGTHIICFNCLNEIINYRISESQPNRGCYENCKAAFDLLDLKRVLGKQLFSHYESAERESIMQASKNQKIFRCPRCNYGLYFEIVPRPARVPGADDDDLLEDPNFIKYPVFNCPKCKNVTCRKCREPDHRPNMCLTELEESEDALIRFVTNAMNDARIRHCPHCNKPTIKVEACNMITCGCGHFFCYHCQWKCDDSDHYKHFGGVSQKGPKENKEMNCPLFYGNNVEEDRKLVERAGNNAIEVWLRKHPKYTNVNRDKIKKIIANGV